MDFIANAQEVLDNYDHKKFHDNLEKEIERRGLKKKAFCEQIEKPYNWIRRRLDYKPEFPELIKMQKLGYDILKLAGIESKKQKFRIPYKDENEEEIIVQGQIIKLSEIHHKVRIILLYEPEKSYLLRDIEKYYTEIQNKIRKAPIEKQLRS